MSTNLRKNFKRIWNNWLFLRVSRKPIKSWSTSTIRHWFWQLLMKTRGRFTLYLPTAAPKNSSIWSTPTIQKTTTLTERSSTCREARRTRLCGETWRRSTSLMRSWSRLMNRRGWRRGTRGRTGPSWWKRSRMLLPTWRPSPSRTDLLNVDWNYYFCSASLSPQ